jgi:hypothetical protein
MKEVDSSNIAAIGYDEQTQTLKIRFKAGGEYHYYDVPKEEHEALLLAKSMGSHFGKNIRNNYKYKKETR